ncbi:hypothetical protein ASPZODRAFT_11911 [Penicilliopsis zonata CBS 506.65]|uniref:Large ribosomal subunit protein mL67 n=1 Tax=Penicilliopsis zonata CBS 506.65 TaxID=1073090 RepID=A0A1L9SV19_9EURO|nr:hypothetical protein ASPZODRAFT_11911 [Penicilliopsis zonata CBS 506.65]OJJ51065.1 hypothetical protein ASPZODRAFT_11911 [Penicilliopsis zonata CBS 506.65]
MSTSKRLTKVLDPTKIGTWRLVRRPPIENHTVIQGKPREQNSNAFKQHQVQEGVRLRKALNSLTHGKNIFVYHNIRTNQVVYSLTRYLEKDNALKQLVFHGKKTVPATLRKDMWVPYYSVHFQDKQIGLRAYHLLREFALQRQLSPPREMITITDSWLSQRRPRDPVQAKEFDDKYATKRGWLMEKKDRARALMDQKATSVADVAAVLAIQEEEIANGFADGKRGYLTRRARQRRREARAKEEEKTAERAERIARFATLLSDPGLEVKIEEQAAEGDAFLLAENDVKILWMDLQDARFAETWPTRVQHGELDQSYDHVISGQKALEGAGELLAQGVFQEKNMTENTKSA